MLREASDSLLPVTNTNDTECGNNETIDQLHRASTLSNVIDDEEQHLTINTRDTENDDDENKTERKMYSKNESTPWMRWGGSNNHNSSAFLKAETLEEQYEEFIDHLRHVAEEKMQFDVYQVLAYRARVKKDDNRYFKPFKPLKGIISEKWSDLEIIWLNSYQRVLCQAICCWVLQTIGITTILITQFVSYFNDPSNAGRAECDYHLERWQSDVHYKLLAFFWTGFISLGVSGWVYSTRHAGFYAILLFMKAKEITYPPFVSITILQIGLLTNYYVVTAAVFGSYTLIYQTEGGTETIGMVLQAVALFFIIDIDHIMVHKRDFRSIFRYFDDYIKHNKHKTLPSGTYNPYSCSFGGYIKCGGDGQSCLQTMVDILSFCLLVIMSVGAVIMPFVVMICW